VIVVRDFGGGTQTSSNRRQAYSKFSEFPNDPSFDQIAEAEQRFILVDSVFWPPQWSLKSSGTVVVIAVAEQPPPN
jgi:hypothetical protein